MREMVHVQSCDRRYPHVRHNNHIFHWSLRFSYATGESGSEDRSEVRENGVVLSLCNREIYFSQIILNRYLKKRMEIM